MNVWEFFWGWDFSLGMFRDNVPWELSGIGVPIPMKDYKSLRVMVTILATVVNTRTDSLSPAILKTQTNTEILEAYTSRSTDQKKG